MDVIWIETKIKEFQIYLQVNKEALRISKNLYDTLMLVVCDYETDYIIYEVKASIQKYNEKIKTFTKKLEIGNKFLEDYDSTVKTFTIFTKMTNNDIIEIIEKIVTNKLIDSITEVKQQFTEIDNKCKQNIKYIFDNIIY